MKKLILATCALGVAVSVFGQGEISFNNRVPGSVVTHIYGPNANNPTLVQTGNGANDTTAGPTDWSAASGWTALLGTGYTAQLWGGPVGTPEGSLTPLTPTSTFFTVAAGAGYLVNVGAVVVPGVPENSTATMTLRVWNNAGGTITSWAAAQAAGVAMGESPLFTTQPLGLTTTPVPNLVGLQSFNISTTVPEPSTFALAGLGAAALLIFRRRK